MKEKTKGILVRPWWIILVILVIIGWFYWFQVRPSIIYSSCHSQALSSIQEPCEGGYITCKLFGKEDLPVGDYEAYYKACLRSRGINK